MSPFVRAEERIRRPVCRCGREMVPVADAQFECWHDDELWPVFPDIPRADPDEPLHRVAAAERRPAPVQPMTTFGGTSSPERLQRYRSMPARCEDCGRRLRAGRVPASEAPGTVGYGGYGRCQRCYLKLRRSGAVAAVPASDGQIVGAFERLGSVKAVAREFSVGVERVSRVLDARGVERRRQRRVGR